MAFLRISILLLALMPLASCLPPPFVCATASTDDTLFIAILGALMTVVNNAPGAGYAKSQNQGGVNAFGRCTGLHNGLSCGQCLANSAATLQKYCANYEDGVVWYNSCFLRYSTKDFFGDWNVQPLHAFFPSNDNSQSPLFEAAVLRLAVTVSNMAVQSGANLFAEMEQPVQEISGVTIYIMAQCTQDLPSSQCQG
ncbi:hypothetical protein HPP92_015073 [Vanilla planifolia]|uniref:Gnk2-homologous domain-containing protein n=1 Tax=Vanilla planifolia TaxID=51239 RepID=A0A835UVD1_VANPL|nr:hypothetical protein HPP92_015073 [Vanilla planifolia]